MIVELFGPPGSGKSFLAPRIAAEQNLPVIRLGIGEKYPLALMFFATHRPLARALLHLWNVHTHRFPVRRRKKLKRLISFLAKEQKARLRGGVVDEGIFQYLLVMHEGLVKPEEIEPVLNLIGPENYIVYIIEARRETREKRMLGRGRVSRGELGEDYQRNWQDILTANAETLTAIFHQRFQCKLVVND